MPAAGGSNPSRTVLSPNWAQLQQKLKVGRRSKPSDPSFPASAVPKPPHAALGKRKERPLDAASSSPPPPSSILSPSSTDCSLTNAIAMDCEMVGVGSQGNISALGRVTLVIICTGTRDTLVSRSHDKHFEEVTRKVNTWGNVIYDEHVRPLERVVEYRTRISGIQPKHLRRAKEFNVVQKEVAELIKGRVLVGHALHNDLKVLLLSHPKKDTRDTSVFRPFLREGRRRALRDLASQILGIKIQQNEHCPIEDARAAMLIYKKNKRAWEKTIKEQFWQRKKPKNH